MSLSLRAGMLIPRPTLASFAQYHRAELLALVALTERALR